MVDADGTMQTVGKGSLIEVLPQVAIFQAIKSATCHVFVVSKHGEQCVGLRLCILLIIKIDVDDMSVISLHQLVPIRHPQRYT